MVVDAGGRVVTGADDGTHLALAGRTPRRRPPQLLAETGGRPLGIEVDPRDGSLIVCDA